MIEAISSFSFIVGDHSNQFVLQSAWMYMVAVDWESVNFILCHFIPKKIHSELSTVPIRTSSKIFIFYVPESNHALSGHWSALLFWTKVPTADHVILFSVQIFFFPTQFCTVFLKLWMPLMVGWSLSFLFFFLIIVGVTRTLINS